MRRRLVATVALAVLAPLLTAPAAGHAAAVTGSPGVAWGACPPAVDGIDRDPRQRCGTVRVPMDYRSPRGRTIEVAVSRIPATRPALRRGVLIVNPGGPGAPGLDFPSFLSALLPPEVSDRFDLVGFDPRGTGRSAPITCHIPSDVPPEVIVRYPAPGGSIDRNVTFARDTANGCAAYGGDLIRHISTANTARDMDRIRAALGERVVSYLGYSYGSYLGAAYRTLYPDRTDRFVLDSLLDPGRIWYDQWRTTGLAVALRLPDFTAWAAARDATYHLGGSPAAVADTFYALADRLDRQPVTLPDGTVGTGNLLRVVTHSQLERDANFPELAALWQFLTGLSATAPATSESRRSGGGDEEVPPDNLRAVQIAINCNDVAWPRDISTYARNVAIDRRLFPATAGAPANIWPCAFWPYRPAEPPVRVVGIGARNILLLQNLRDPDTPWFGALGMRRALGSTAVMVSVDQGGHTVYLVTASTCANDTATAFLAHGLLPGRDRRCAGQPLPA